MVSRRWLIAMVAALVVDVIFAVIVRADGVNRFARGDHTIGNVFAVAGLIWLGVVLTTAFGFFRSVRDTRRSMRRRTRAMATAAATSADWLWEADEKHRITYSSSGVKDLLGYTPEELIGRSTLSLVAADEAGKAERLMHHSVATRTGWDAVELVWQHADGSPVLLHGTAAPILDQHGTVVGFRGTRRSVTTPTGTDDADAAARERLVRVLRDGAVDVALQPIVDLGTGEVAGVEALARFRDGRGPEQWFREANDAGHALDLDHLTFTAALRLLEQIPAPVHLSINASPDLITRGLPLHHLEQAGVPLDRLVIEITEHVRINDYRELDTALASLRERGVRLAIDDTGAGYASLAHVLQLRPDIIKVDRSLIARVASDPARRSLVTALVLLALDLRATVTAEGVETPAELETLASLGVDHAQGYLFARPQLDPATWATWWHRNWLASSAPASAGGART